VPKFRHIADIHRPRLTRGKIALLAGSSLAVVAALVLGALMVMPSLRKTEAAQALTLATTKQPEQYTELYFINPTNLPKTVKAGVAEGFAYRVINHQGRTVTYHARTTMVANGQAAVLGTTSFTLQPGQTRDIDVPFTAPAEGQALEFIVDLPEQQLGIHFRSRS
jgi:hypothetical protein